MTHCPNHVDLLERIKRVEENDRRTNQRIDPIVTKLNLILGGIVISPFIVALLTLLIKVKV